MNVRDKKGSITIFVLVGLLFMSGFLLISFGNNINKSKIAREQYNIIGGIYSHNDGDANAYERAYTDLRENTKTSMITSVEDMHAIDLYNTYGEDLIDYKIYGKGEVENEITGVGDYVSDITDLNFGKYKIPVKISGDNVGEQIYNIYLNSPLKSLGDNVDYIDFKNQKVVRSVGIKTEQTIELPSIVIFEDYTRVEVLTEVIPSKIELEYIGYSGKYGI